MWSFLSSFPPALPSPPPSLSSCNYPLPTPHPHPSEWYARHAASRCSRVSSLSPFLPSPATSEALLLAGYLLLPAAAVYEFQIAFSNHLRLYLGDPAEPCFAAFSPTIATHSFVLFLPAGPALLRILWEPAGTLLNLHFRPRGEGEWQPVDETVVRGGAAFPTFLAAENVVTLLGEPVQSAPPRGGGASCVEFTVEPSLPSTLEIDAKTGILHGVLHVVSTHRNHL